MSPLFSMHHASAITPNVNFSDVTLTQTELDTNWKTDRTTPSGGYGSVPFAGRTAAELKVDNTKANTSDPYNQTEGIQRHITASDAVKADLYVDSAWTGKQVRAGLWGVGQDTNSAITAYPIIEFTQNASFIGWRAWDGVNGGWTNLPSVAYNTDGWNTLEISLNPITHQFNLFINGNLATSNAGDVSTSIGTVILNEYNYAQTAAADYNVHWSNFAYGNFAAVTPTVTTITGNTSSAENQPGWMFNRDTSTSTPFNFSTAKHSTGSGSIYVAPIGTNASDKFVAEDFGQTSVSDLNSISYDYLIAGNGTAASAHQFYLNVYANVDNSSNFYDCRFDYVPTSGSTSSFTTASFTATSTPVNVQHRGSRISTCPTTLAGMPAGSYVRMFSVSVGDTSSSDTGLAGYLDNIVVNKISGINAYDFEYPPLTTPGNGLPNNSYKATNDFYFTWGAVMGGTAPYTYEFQSSLNPASANGVLTTDVWHSGVLTSPTIHSTGAPDGTWYWQVRAIDATGVTSDWSPIWNVTLDTHAPTVPTNLSWKTSANAIVPNNGYTNDLSGTASWQASTSSDVDHYAYKYWNDIPGSPYKPGSEYIATTSATNLAGVFNQGEGVHHFCVASVDHAGNSSACSSTFTITYDHTAPIVTITAPHEGDTVHGTVTLSGTVTDINPDHYYFVVKDSHGTVKAGPGTVNAATVSSWNWNTKNVPDGQYTIVLEARDKAGNKDAGSVANVHVTVDNTAPVVTDNFTVNMLTGDKVTLTPTVTGDSNVTYAWSVSNEKLQNDPQDPLNGSSLKIGPAPKGSYTASVTVTDASGNQTTKTYNVTISTPADAGTTGNTNAPQTLGASTSNKKTFAAASSSTPAPGSTDQQTTPKVLGDSTTKPETVHFANDTATRNDTDAQKASASFLGLGWWWLAVAAALLGIFWFFLGRRVDNSK